MVNRMLTMEVDQQITPNMSKEIYQTKFNKKTLGYPKPIDDLIVSIYTDRMILDIQNE